MTEAIWFKPVCDQILDKIANWYINYFMGGRPPAKNVYASKPYMSEKTGRVEERVTMVLHKIKFTELELRHLNRLLNLIIPNKPITTLINKVYKGLKKGILIPPNYYLVDLVAYQSEVKEIYDALIKAKSGQLEDISTVISKQDKEEAPFEL
jgi:hypothetical protein